MTMRSVLVEAILPERSMTSEAVHDCLVRMLEKLQGVFPPPSAWVSLPRAPDRGLMPLSNPRGFMERMQRYADADRVDYGTLPSTVEGVITTAHTPAAWLSPGRVEIALRPWFGVCTISLYQPVEAFGRDGTLQMVRSVVAALAEVLGVLHIATDVTCALPDGEGFDTYVQHHRLFPHRRWLGWMGFVPELVPHRYIPEAASVHVVKGCGTIIVSVEGCLDLRNKAHLRQVHEVEARMAQLGLLDLTDATLLE